MKTASKTAVLFIFLVSLAGCGHKTKAVPPPQAQAPVAPPSDMTHTATLPPLPPPSTPDVVIASTQEENPEPVHPKKPPRHKPSPAKPAATGDATASQPGEKSASSTQTQIANGASADVSPIGQLSSSGDAAGTQGHREIEQLINSTENGLNGIKRTLTSDEQLTATQIKTFLAKARQALNDSDLDGAQTLATKAKVLLDELTKK
jgi:predicted small lipoprotein YifL